MDIDDEGLHLNREYNLGKMNDIIKLRRIGSQITENLQLPRVTQRCLEEGSGAWVYTYQNVAFCCA